MAEYSFGDWTYGRVAPESVSFSRRAPPVQEPKVRRNFTEIS